MNYPIQPLPALQRLGWLIHFSSLKCRRTVSQLSTFNSQPSFRAARRYPFTTETVKVRATERRAGRDGVSRPVHLTGLDLLVRLRDEQGQWHRFLTLPATKNEIIHDFRFLVEHFEIPDIPDLARLQPGRFREYKRKLRALEMKA